MPTNVKLVQPGFSQASNRSVVFWFDQHKDPNFRNADGVAIFEMGRPYWSWVERPAEGTAAPMPVGEVIPMGWTAPFQVPQKYITRSIGRVKSDGDWLKGAGSTQFFRIDWAQMAKDDKEAMDAYYELAVQEAVRLKEPLPRYGQPLSIELRLVVGRPPRSPKIAEAAMAGDKWLLGQQMPIWDPTLGKHVIPENEELARLLRMSHADILTPEQDVALQQREAKDDSDLRDMVKRQSDMLERLYEELDRLKSDKPKGGRKRKAEPVATE